MMIAPCLANLLGLESRGRRNDVHRVPETTSQKIRTIALTISDEAVSEAANKIIAIGTAAAIKVKGKL